MISLATLLLVCGMARGLEVSETLQQLNVALQTRTNVFYYEGAMPDGLQHLLAQSAVPSLVLQPAKNAQSAPALRHKFHASILAVVCLEDEESGSLLLDVVKSSLQQWHKVDVLFIADDVGVAQDAARGLWLFDWCWRNGFVHVLLTGWRGNAKLLRYKPLPDIRPKETTISEYVAARSYFNNFHGHTIRISVGSNPPRVRVRKDARGQFIYSGLWYIFVRLFTHYYNATLREVLQPNYESASLLDCLANLRRGLVDVCAEPMVLNPEFPISTPVLLSFTRVMVRTAQPLENFRYFVIPFDTHVWLAIALTIAYVGVLGAWVNWRRQGTWDFSGSLLRALCIMLYISYDYQRLRTKSEIFIYLLIIVTGFMLSNMYLAILSSMLTAHVYEHHIDSLQDMADAKVKLAVADYDTDLFKMFPVAKILWELLDEQSIKDIQWHQRTLNTTFAYACHLDKCSYILHQQKFLQRPRLRLMSEVLNGLWAGVVMRMQWPFQEALNRYSLHFFQAGLLSKTLDDMQEEGIRLGHLHFLPTEHDEATPLGAAYFQMPSFLFAFGYTMAFVAFVVELCVVRRLAAAS